MKIVFGDLRHNTVGRHSAFAPVALGYISSYAQKSLGDDAFEFVIEILADDVIAYIENESPGIVALANYCWNAELNRRIWEFAKAKNPDVICIGGGPEFPIAPQERTSYLAERPYLDFYVFGEGEQSFTSLLKALLEGGGRRTLAEAPTGGIAFLNPDRGQLVEGAAVTRLMDLDDIPSPYLNGSLDQFLDGKYVPFLESARGCPYSCTFCSAGEAWYNKIASFSVGRICAELDYIASRVMELPNLPLAIADSNFGMLKRDEDIAEHLATLRDTLGWPVIFDVSTGKSQPERIIRIAEKLNNKLVVSLSVQSMNSTTLAAVKRKNLDGGNFQYFYNQLKALGINSYSDLIVPMPMETRESFFQGLKDMCRASVDRFIPFTTMLLKGTSLATEESRTQYGLQSKYRVLPRQFGKYAGALAIECEEVAIATNTMSFTEYLECRGLSFILKAYSHTIFEPLERLADEVGVERFDFIHEIWSRVHRHETGLTGVYEEFVRLTELELFESPEAIYEHYGSDSRYRDLTEGKEGDNIMHRSFAMLLMDYCADAIKLGYDVIRTLCKESSDADTKKLIDDAQAWMLATRNLSPVLRLDERAFVGGELELEYDVVRWVNNHEGRPLNSFKRPVHYRLSIDKAIVSTAVNDSQAMVGGKSPSYWVPWLLDNHNISDYWLYCEDINVA